MRSFIGNCPILLVYPIWAVVSLKLPAISLPIFSGRKICLQNVRDVPVICGILGSLQYPSFAQANTVSESHYARTHDWEKGKRHALSIPQQTAFINYIL